MEKSGDESIAVYLTVVHSDKGLKDDSRDEKHDLSKPKSQILVTNGKDSDDEESKISKDSSVESRQLLRPFSMFDFGQTRRDRDGAAARPEIRRSISSFNWIEKYEEYKPPKRYQKPITKINTRLSRTFVTGAGIEKCKNCGVRLYEMEKINANHFAYHRSCFRCSRCQRLLNLGTFTSVDGQLFCKSHFLYSIAGTSSGDQLTDEDKEESTVREQITYNHGKEISTDVTLTSVLDIKPHFESPSKFKEATMKNWKRHQLSDEDKNIHPHRLNADYNSKETEKLERESDRLLLRHHNHMNQEIKSSSLEIKPDNNNCETLSKDVSLLLSNVEKGNNNEKDFKFSGTFANHRNAEHRNEAKVSLTHKTTAPKAEILPHLPYPHHHQHRIHPQTKNIGLSYNDSGYFRSSVSIGQSPNRSVSFEVNGMPAKTLHDRNGIPKHAMKQSYADNDNFKLLNKDTQITGIAKRLRNHWESKDLLDGRHLPTLKTDVHLRGTGMNVIPRKMFRDNMSVSNVHNVDGFKTDGDGLNHRAELFFRENAPHEKSHSKERRDDDMLLIVPLNFTQTQLAKFKQLEAMAIKYATPYSTKKMFRWEVKEPSPLNRPNSHFNYERTEAQRRTRSDGEHRWESFPGTLPNRHGHAPFALTSAVHQLKTLDDDPSLRPAPNPVLAMTQQMAAMATINKPYHNITHVSYNVL